MIELREVLTRRKLQRFVASPERSYARQPQDVPTPVGEELAVFSPRPHRRLRCDVKPL
jgi:hypothetical protein